MGKYLEELKSAAGLSLLIIGQDPYKNGAHEIAFCKDTMNELFDKDKNGHYSSGKYILNSLGYEKPMVIEDFETPDLLFNYLLNQHKIGFIDASPKLLLSMNNNEKIPDYVKRNIKDSNVGKGVEEYSEIINRLIKKSEKVFVIGTLTKVICRNAGTYVKKGNFLRRFLNMPSVNVGFLIHPSEHNINMDEWQETWAEDQLYLKKKMNQGY